MGSVQSDSSDNTHDSSLGFPPRKIVKDVVNMASFDGRACLMSCCI